MSKITVMETREQKEVVLYNDAIHELVRVIGHNSKLKDFLAIKFDDRTDYIQEEEAKKNKGQSGVKDGEEDLNRIRRYEAALDHLREVTDTKEVKSITKSFLQKEEDNFALFKYINELRDEEIEIKEAILKVQQEIKELEEEDVRVESNRTVWLRDLEERGTVAGKAADFFEENVAETAKVLHELRDGVSSLFDVLGCDGSFMQDVLASEDGITDKTIMSYMGIIERTALELLKTYHFIMMAKKEPIEDKKGNKEININNYTRVPVRRMITVTTPHFQEEDLMVESDSMPLTVEEVRAYVNKKMSEDSSQRVEENIKESSEEKRTSTHLGNRQQKERKYSLQEGKGGRFHVGQRYSLPI